MPLICQLHSFLFYLLSNEYVPESWDNRVVDGSMDPTSPLIHSGVLSTSSIILCQQEDTVFKECPKVSHLDKRMIFYQGARDIFLLENTTS